MGKSMFQLLSLTDVFLLVLSVPYKYYLVQQGKNWSDAQTYCRANYIDLATVEGKDDMIKLQIEAQKHQFTSSAWIGLYNDVNSWRWSMENQPLGSLADWCSDQPNYAMEACAALNQWCWFDVPCSLSYPFFCFDVRNTGSSRYVLISTSMAFHDAQSYCRQHHTDLASVRDVEEYSVIKNTVSSNSWVGLFRDLWKWSDQSNFSNISWVSGKPSGAGKTDNCGHFINGQVDAAQCSEIMPFFCLSDFTKKQIMRMKVQSNQDANDPAVKAAILQKIKQNLKELGIAKNTAMKWREQPDGMVFHKTKENNYEGIKTREKCDL